MRFYKYLIYRFYTWRLGKKDDTPVATIVFTMSLVHFFQLFILLVLLAWIFPPLIIVFKQEKVVIFLSFFIISLLYYILVYDKQKWLGYVEQYKDETPEERKRGTIYVLFFTVGSLILFFMLLAIIIIKTAS